MNPAERLRASIVQQQDAIVPVYRAASREDRLAKLRGLLEEFNRDTTAFLVIPDGAETMDDLVQQIAGITSSVTLILSTLVVELEELS